MDKQSLKYLLYLIILTIFMDQAIGYIYDQLYFSEKSQRNDRLIHSAVGTSEDILIFGSSRAYHHYNPMVFENCLGMSCYNVGYGGQNIYYHLALLKSSVIRHKPKIAILELLYIDFEKTDEIFDTEKLSILLPFAKKSQIYYDAVLMRGEEEKIKLMSAIYPLNSKLLYILRNNLTIVDNNYNGYHGLKRTWHAPIQKSDQNLDITIDGKKIAALNEFIKICEENGIELFIFVSPHYIINEHGSIYDYVIKELENSNKVIIRNFESSSDFINNPDLFADPFHLNHKGATIYSDKVCEIIKRLQ